MTIQILIPPLIGAAIGYITNYIAIKMLFRPRNPVFIGGFRLPFTPGLIPKEKARVARSIGTAVSTHLLSEEVILEQATSESAIAKLEQLLWGLVDEYRTSEQTLSDVLEATTDKKTLQINRKRAEQAIAEILRERLKNGNYGEMLTVKILERVKEKLDSSLVSILTLAFDDTLIQALGKEVGKLLGGILNDDGDHLIAGLVHQKVDNIIEKPIGEVIVQYEEKLPKVISGISALYKTLAKENIPKLLQSFDLGQVVEARVATFDAEQIEQLIFGIMKKEMNAIVYLGAILGFLMGWVNVLLSFI